MKYSNVKDILPALIQATQAAKVVWQKASGDRDYKVTIGEFGVEIEQIVETSEHLPLFTIVVYLWNKDRKIIDSHHVRPDDPEFGVFRQYLEIIESNTNDVPGALATIMSLLSEE